MRTGVCHVVYCGPQSKCLNIPSCGLCRQIGWVWSSREKEAWARCRDCLYLCPLPASRVQYCSVSLSACCSVISLHIGLLIHLFLLHTFNISKISLSLLLLHRYVCVWELCSTFYTHTFLYSLHPRNNPHVASQCPIPNLKRVQLIPFPCIFYLTLTSNLEFDD